MLYSLTFAESEIISAMACSEIIRICFFVPESRHGIKVLEKKLLEGKSRRPVAFPTSFSVQTRISILFNSEADKKVPYVR